jgi:hypothetical protein
LCSFEKMTVSIVSKIIEGNKKRHLCHLTHRDAAAGGGTLDEHGVPGNAVELGTAVR